MVSLPFRTFNCNTPYPRFRYASPAICLLWITFLFPKEISAQTKDSDIIDSSDHAAWIEMMYDRSASYYDVRKAFDDYWKNRVITRSSGYKVFKRWAYLRELEMDSNGFPRNPGLRVQSPLNPEAVSYSNAVSGFDSLTQCVFDSTWAPLGPYRNKDAGRTNAIAFHPADPQTIMIGAASGGIWKSRDGGQNWQIKNLNARTLGISSLVWDANNSNILYAGTGDFNLSAKGDGIYKSTDTGNTWFPIQTGMPAGLTVTKIICDPRNSGHLLIGTDQGIYRSINGGATWKKSTYAGYTYIRDLVFNTSFSNIVYATSRDEIYRSTDSGKTFVKSKGINLSGYRGAIAVSAADSSFVYFLLCDVRVFRGVYLSRNFGDSFELQSSTPNLMDYSSNGSGNNGQAFYCMDIAVNPLNKNEVFVGGINIYRSTNEGKNWAPWAHWTGDNSPYVHADIQSLEFSPLTNQLHAACDGGIYVRKSTWESLSYGLNIHQAYKISTSGAGRVLAGFQDNGSWMNNSRNGDLFIEKNDGDGLDNAVDPGNPEIFYTAQQNGKIYRVFSIIAENGRNGINEDGDWLTPFVLQEGKPENMFAGFKSIWRSNALSGTNITFKNICDVNSNSNEFINDIENSPFDNNILYFSRKNGGFYRTVSAGSSAPAWTNLTGSKPASGMINDIQCSHLDSNTVYIALNDNIYKSSDRGSTWTNISNGLPAVYVYCIAIDTSEAEEYMYCGTSDGVYIYSRTSAAWKKYGKSLPDHARVTDLEISYSTTYRPSDRLLASTYGRGIWSIPLIGFRNTKPVSGFSNFFSKRIYCKGREIRLTDASEGYKIQHEWIGDSTSFNFTFEDTLMVNSRVRFLKTGRAEIKKAVHNCEGSDTASDDSYIVLGDTKNPACVGRTLYASSPGEYGLRRLTVNTDQVSSAGTKTTGSYEDHRCKTVFELKPGKFNTVSASMNPLVNEYLKIYVDMDNSGSFDESEAVFHKKMGTYNTDSFFLPSVMTMNQPVLMRAMSDYFPIDTNACPDLSFGQTEDYSAISYAETAGFIADRHSVCMFDTVVFEDSSSGIFSRYDWEFGEGAVPASAKGSGPHKVIYTNPGYKNVRLTLNNGLYRFADSFVAVSGKPEAEIERYTVKKPVCSGDSFILRAKSKETGLQEYTWLFHDTIVSKQSELLRFPVQLSDTGLYVLHISNGCLTDTLFTYLDSLHHTPEIEIIVNGGKEQCLENNRFECIARIKCAEDFSFEWENMSQDTFRIFSSVQSGIYRIGLKAFSPVCSDSSHTFLTVYPDADASFSYQYVTGLEVKFSPEDTSLVKYFWNFGDGTNSSSPAPTHLFPEYDKDYTVQLTGGNMYACEDSSLQIIHIKSSSLDLPGITGLNVYPNPATNEINLQIPGHISGKIDYRLVNVLGENILSGTCSDLNTPQNILINLHNVPSGLYLLQIFNQNNKLTFKVLIQ